MGRGTWDDAAWSAARASYTRDAKPTVDSIYTSTAMPKDLDPAHFDLRESRDSAANPSSTAIILALDVTGSMGRVLDVMARTGLGTLVGGLYERRPVSDPHIMVMGVGDVESDSSPIQATQFEAENAPMVKQMESIYLERGGGGNHYESYSAVWYVAATKTSIDCFEKRGKKGYLFTVGDEEPTRVLRAAHIKSFLGIDESEDFEPGRLLEMASMTYEVFHVMVEEGSYYRSAGDRVRSAWTGLLGQRALALSDHTKLAELVISAIQVNEGASAESVVASWDGSTGLVVSRGIGGLTAGGPKKPGIEMVLY